MDLESLWDIKDIPFLYGWWGLFIHFYSEEIPSRTGVQSCSLGFVLDDLEVISDIFFKGNSEQCVPGMVFCSSQHAAAGSTNPCHKKSYLDSQVP